MFTKPIKKQQEATDLQSQASEMQAAPETLKVYNLIILDKSGSMSSIASAAIDGFNETVGGIRSAQERFAGKQEHYVSLYVFCDCDKKYLYENVPVEKVKKLTSREYRPCCCTPLYDAMGISLNKLLKQIQSDKNSTAVVTVITDGLENASKEYSGTAIKALVERLQSEEGWNFAYIGTNQDVTAVARDLSITNTMFFEDTCEGMSTAWSTERKSKNVMYSRMQEDFECCEMSMDMDISEAKRFRARRNREEKNYLDINEFQGRIAPDRISSLRDGEIFVFGSNLAGAHGGGAARIAVERFGAVMGQGVGLQGQSYAIPTMQGGVSTIVPYVDEFIQFAKEHPEMTFLVTRIGCGIAGFTDREIAPLFAGAIKVPNIHLPLSFWKELI